MSRTTTVARKDVDDAVRSRRYWLLVVLAFGLPTGLALLYVGDVPVAPGGRSPVEQRADLFVGAVESWFEGMAPFLSIALGYRAIAGERESGSLRTLLATGTSRREVFLGKLLGRSVVLVGSLVAGFVGVAAVSVARFGPVGLGTLALTAGLVVAYALSWLWAAVGLSAAAATRYRALAPLFGLALGFLFLWRGIAVRLLALAFTGDPTIADLERIPQASGPDWYVYGARLSPRVAFDGLADYLDHALLGGEFAAGGAAPNRFGAAVLVGWGLLLVVAGYWRFRRADVAGDPTGRVEALVDESLAAVGAGVGLGGGGGSAADQVGGSTATTASSDGAAAGTTVEGGAGTAAGSGASEAGGAAPDRTTGATGPRRRPPLGLPALTVAKKEFAGAVRSKLLWSLGSFFFTIVALQNYFTAVSDGRQVQAFRVTGETMAIVVPFVALVAGYRAVVGERESGSLKLLLGAPVTRRDVAVGKYLGRLAVVLAVLWGGMLCVGVVYLSLFEYLTVERLVATTAVVTLYGLTWLGIAIGASALSRSGSMAVATIFGAFVFFGGLWDALVGRALAAAFGGGSPVTASVIYDGQPAWYVYGHRLNPTTSYEALNSYAYHLATDTLGNYGDPGAVVLPNAFALVVLLAWATVPLVVGYRRFSTADIE